MTIQNLSSALIKHIQRTLYVADLIYALKIINWFGMNFCGINYVRD